MKSKIVRLLIEPKHKRAQVILNTRAGAERIYQTLTQDLEAAITEAPEYWKDLLPERAVRVIKKPDGTYAVRLNIKSLEPLGFIYFKNGKARIDDEVLKEELDKILAPGK